MVTVKSGTPILPATVKTGGTIPVAVKQMSTQSNVVKIALPPSQQQQLVRTSSAPVGHMVTGAKAQRIILPSPASFSSSDALIQTKVITIPDSKVSIKIVKLSVGGVDDFVTHCTQIWL
jgi:hypothetical protein